MCLESSDQTVSSTEPTQFALPCSFQGVPGTQITFGPAQHGALSVVDAADGTVEYTPLQDGWVGPDQFSYEITNANGASTTGSIAVLTQGDWAPPQLSSTTASPGGQVGVTASGLTPGEKVQVVLHSDPVLLESVRADGDGEVHATVTIPEDAPLGDHHIEVLGETSGSRLVPIALTKASGTGATGTATGGTDRDSTPWGAIALVGGVAVLAIGAIAALATRRKRQV